MSQEGDIIETLNLIYICHNDKPLTKREKAIARSPFLWKGVDILSIIDSLRESEDEEHQRAVKGYEILFENMFE